MGEISMGCQYGIRFKNGKRVRGPSCFNRAHGLWLVVFGRGRKVLSLCAECGFNRMPNHVKMVENKAKELIFYHDVVEVKLLVSFGTQFNQEAAKPEAGSKHWVESPLPKARRPLIVPKTVVKPKQATKPLDMAAYLNQLSRHDDGK